MTRGQGKAELVRCRGGAEDAGAVLVPELVSGRREPTGPAVENVDCAGVADVPEVLERDPHGQVVVPVAVEVRRGQR